MTPERFPPTTSNSPVNATSRSSLAITSLLLTAACQPHQHEVVAYGDDDLVVLSVPGERLCSGSIDVVVAEYDRIRENYGANAETSTQLHVRVGSRAAEEFCSERERSVAGCAGTTANGTLSAVGQVDVVSHELVHGVRRQYGYFGNRFIEEGLAEYDRAGAFRAYGVATGSVDIDAELESFGGTGASYVGAISFVDFLAKRFGEDTVRHATTSPGYSRVVTRADLDTWFRDSFDESLSGAIEAFHAAERPALIERAGPCAVRSPQAAPYTFDAEVDCGVAGVGVFESELGEPTLQSVPECFETPSGGGMLQHRSLDGVTITVTTWTCVDGAPASRQATVLHSQERVALDPSTCRFSVGSSGPASGYTLAWSLD